MRVLEVSLGWLFSFLRWWGCWVDLTFDEGPFDECLLPYDLLQFKNNKKIWLTKLFYLKRLIWWKAGNQLIMQQSSCMIIFFSSQNLNFCSPSKNTLNNYTEPVLVYLAIFLIKQPNLSFSNALRSRCPLLAYILCNTFFTFFDPDH